MIATPLLTRDLDAPLAFIARPLDALSGLSGLVTARVFLSHVAQVAALLPKQQFAINLCENRYFFMVAFCAAIVRGQTNILPPNRKAMTLLSLAECYKNCGIVHDGIVVKDGVAGNDHAVVKNNAAAKESTSLENLPQTDLSALSVMTDFSDTSSGNIGEIAVIPTIPLDQLAAISFTSGSTGDSRPNRKSWQVIVESSRKNAEYMLAGYRNQVLYQLATVPPQHMWGLETSIFLPLFEAVCVADARPLFPVDIKEALHKLPQPRMMVSTPVHLRALCSSQLNYPPLKLILCATSPLNQELARQTERRFSAQLREVYGCSEIGSMATRKTTTEAAWTLFSNIQIEIKDALTIACTSYLPDPVVLQDKLQMLDNSHFRLQGRATDMVDIAGKRGSLFEINKVLMGFTGIIDGVVFLPESDRRVGRLVALVVLNKHASIDHLKNYLREHLDDAFIPRPLLQIEKMPREDNGKLTLQCLNECYRRLVDGRAMGLSGKHSAV